MVEIGKINNLRVIRIFELGAHVDGGELGEILLPKKFVPPHCQKDDLLDAFIYYDSEDRIIATTQKPLAQVGEFAFLEVVEVNRFGAFMDWGLPKDLLVPFREQRSRMQMGERHIVHLYFDEKSGRIAGSCKINRFLNKTTPDFEIGQAVHLLLSQRSDLGMIAIINNSHSGMIFQEDIFMPLEVGQKITGYIKKIRPDGKIDLLLQKPGFAKVNDLSLIIIDYLKKHDGFLPLTDNSTPADISALLGVSKKTFKKAVGTLYRERIIVINQDGIRWNPQ